MGKVMLLTPFTTYPLTYIHSLPQLIYNMELIISLAPYPSYKWGAKKPSWKAESIIEVQSIIPEKHSFINQSFVFIYLKSLLSPDFFPLSYI